MRGEIDLSLRLKKRFLELLEKDPEFKYTVAGYIGLYEILKRLDEHGGAIKELQETIKKLGEAVKELQEAVRDLSTKVNAIGNRYGVVTEEAFRSSIRYLVEDLLKLYKVERWIYYDSEGLVYGRPSVVEVDMLIRDGERVLVEYKVHADKSDVAELGNIGKLYEKVTGVKPRLLLVAPTIKMRARSLAEELGVELRGSIID
jgi:Uncharacterized conserved protein containing a coiled-coil domain, COG5493